MAAGKRGTHTGCWQGKRVRVVLSDGRILIEKFLSQASKHIVLDKTGKIEKKLLLSFSIYRAPQKDL